MKTTLCIIVLFTVFTFACKSVTKTGNNASMTNDSFTLLSATSQSWTAGIPGGGSGTEYYFNVKIKTSRQLLFDSAWINDSAFKIFLAKDKTPVSSEPITFSKGDTITLRVSELIHQNTHTTSAKPPINFTGAALLSYMVKDKPAYFIIKEITRLPSLNRQ
ncbi:MAG TPA: hypothetical protein VI603_13015 [Saprospiraceae bacterium]|nr:hypothetical protein [Saprospiraceae bacterium]